MSELDALRIQHLVLWFTAGGLAGLPVGWWLGWATHEQRLWRQLVASMVGMFALDRQVEAFVLEMTLRYPAAKEAA